jgi:hypothetical protein
MAMQEGSSSQPESAKRAVEPAYVGRRQTSPADRRGFAISLSFAVRLLLWATRNVD